MATETIGATEADDRLRVRAKRGLSGMGLSATILEGARLAERDGLYFALLRRIGAISRNPYTQGMKLAIIEQVESLILIEWED